MSYFLILKTRFFTWMYNAPRLMFTRSFHFTISPQKILLQCVGSRRLALSERKRKIS